jgi:hypothetical protein
MVYNENIKNTARKSDPGQGLQTESYNRAEDCWEMTKFMVGGGGGGRWYNLCGFIFGS